MIGNAAVGALAAYRQMQGVAPPAIALTQAAAAPGNTAAPAGFGDILGQVAQDAISTGEHTDAAVMQAVRGGGDLTSVVTAVSQAELALQTTVAVRDRVLSAYHDILGMAV